MSDVCSVGVCAATFYGDTRLHLPLNESITRLDLRLDFLTGRPGRLFSAVGSADFLHVEVTSSGRVVTSVDRGSGRPTAVASPAGVSSVADRRWHAVSVVLRPYNVQLTLDDVFRSRATLSGDFVELNVDVGVQLGDARYPELPATTPVQDSSTSFRGCLRSVMFSGVDVLAAVRHAGPDTASRSTTVTWNRCDHATTGFGRTTILSK